VSVTVAVVAFATAAAAYAWVPAGEQAPPPLEPETQSEVEQPPAEETRRPELISGSSPGAPRGSARLQDVAVTPRAAPTRVRIPELGVDAPIIGVGARDGVLSVPDDSRTVAWYRYGPSPGGQGSAVLAAHVATARDGHGVFIGLRRLRPGDLVDVEMDDGTSRHFVVEETRQHAKSDLPVDDLFARDGEPRLVLITCGGDFDAAARSYTDNVVVLARPVG
jgi:LPXTG-site transpeptidase (sortase) family protein